jgi:ATP-dependent RNA helicase DeaD
VLVFTRTKIAAAQLAEKLEARGHAVAAIHGDMTQPLRERVLERLRAGRVDVVVATDVAARGLDVERLSHVVNYDLPNDFEAYVHRIGRTGRAGRAGVAVLFVTPRERRLLRELERFTGQRIAPMPMPTAADIATRRKELFKDSLRKAIAEGELELHLALVEELVEEGLDLAEIAAAATLLAGRDRPLGAATLAAAPPVGEAERAARGAWRGEPASGRAGGREREPGGERPRERGGERGRERRDGDEETVRLYLDAGRSSGVGPGDIVGALANEAGIPGREIGAIDVHDQFSLVDVPARYAAQVIERMSGVTLRGRPLAMRPAEPGERELPRVSRPGADAARGERDRGRAGGWEGASRGTSRPFPGGARQVGPRPPPHGGGRDRAERPPRRPGGGGEGRRRGR